MAFVDPGLITRLACAEGSAVFAAIAELLPRGYADSQVLRVQSALRSAGFDADLVAAALTQARLRERGAEKLGAPAAGMFFTADGLEQATRPAVAAEHARRFVAAGLSEVVDLGCGIGSDALAIAGAGLSVHAVDADPVTAAVAAHNLAGMPNARVSCARAEDVAAPSPAGVWFDPARRTPGVADAAGRTRRTNALESLSPSWEFVLATAAAHPATGAKLSPAMPHSAIPADCEAEWVSWRGDVVECALWWGPLRAGAVRSALVLSPAGRHRVIDDGGPAGAPGGPVDRWLFEADRAVVRAGLTRVLARRVGGRELATDVGYVTAPAHTDVPWARGFEVLDVLPLQPKTVRAWLRARGHRGATIKVRGLKLHEPTVRKGFGIGTAYGDDITLILTRAGTESLAVAVRPVACPG